MRRASSKDSRSAETWVPRRPPAGRFEGEDFREVDDNRLESLHYFTFLENFLGNHYGTGMPTPPAAEWLEQIAEYWREEHPDREFSRVRALLGLGRLSFQMPAFQKRVLEPFQLSPSDYSILGALRRAGGTRTLVPGDLYSALQCTPGGLTKMIARLERQGLVERLTDEADGRRAHIRLTTKGAEVERKAGTEYLEGANRLLANLSPAEIDQINEALALLLESFEREDL